MTYVEVYLAGPPMAKQRVRVTKTGHAYTPERTVNYEARLAYAAQQAMQKEGLPPLAGPLRVKVTIKMPIAASKPKRWQQRAANGLVLPTKKPDYDNFAKMADALNLIVWQDDAQIVDSRVLKLYSETPGYFIQVWTIDLEGG